MKYIITILILSVSLFVKCQTDTLTVNGKTYSGSVNKVYSDRLLYTVNGTQFHVMKSDISAMSIRNRIILNGVAGYEYVSDLKLLNAGAQPDFHDQRYFVKTAGINGLAGTALIIIGGTIAGIGASQTGDGKQLLAVGSVLGSIGFCMYVPMSIFLIKAGTSKPIKTL